MIHRYIDLLEELAEYVPFVGVNLGQSYVGVLTRDPGQDPTQITNTTANIIVAPILHPNGQKILFSHTGNLMEIPVDGTPGDETLIWDGSAGISGHDYSPDGNTILFTYLGAGVDDTLFTIPADGTDQSGNETAIHSDASSRRVAGAAYNFDGSKIGFHVLHSSTVLGIWVCNADGSGATNLDTSPTQFSQTLFDVPIIAWMRGSSRLAWNDGTLAAPVWKAMDDDGTNVTTLVTLGSGDGRPGRFERWAPDDSYIIYQRNADSNIYKAAANGSGETLLINPTSFPSTQNTWVFGSRLYWDASGDIYSSLLDGTDERNESAATSHSLRLLG